MGNLRNEIAEARMKNDVGIEMASVIPNFHGKYDIYDLVSCIAPRRLLIVSAEDDKYSRDASKTKGNSFCTIKIR